MLRLSQDSKFPLRLFDCSLWLFMVLKSSSELIMQALIVKTADSFSFSETWLNVVEPIWLQLVVSWSSKVYHSLLSSVLQLIVQFEKRWIHLVGSVVANYAQPIRPICLVMALQGPCAPILPLNPRSNKKQWKNDEEKAAYLYLSFLLYSPFHLSRNGRFSEENTII